MFVCSRRSWQSVFLFGYFLAGCSHDKILLTPKKIQKEFVPVPEPATWTVEKLYGGFLGMVLNKGLPIWKVFTVNEIEKIRSDVMPPSYTVPVGTPFKVGRPHLIQTE